ncbi:hypothetical protein NPIL_624861 [Nephila pilipes]|uniref:Uncharacterized protein n=1 Tax=Nephila pilipes TaxID=299642 RepID=A0A8X6TCR2_NEPPI|nr:hypothetical protein NPIL_624861 [Nephila pilipes]
MNGAPRTKEASSIFLKMGVVSLSTPSSDLAPLPPNEKTPQEISGLIGRTVNFGPLGPGFETTLPRQGQQLSPLPRGRKATTCR